MKIRFGEAQVAWRHGRFCCSRREHFVVRRREG